MASTLLAVANNAVSTAAGAINNSSDPVTFSVAAGEGALFPSTFPFHITIDSEILSVTARSTDSLTASRAQQGTTIASHSAGATVELRVTAKSISDLNTAVNTLENKFPIADADVSDSITLSNLTQITTRAHSSLSSLSADDHTQYALLAGRSGGQTLYGGTQLSDALTLKPSNVGSPTGALTIDLSGSNSQILRLTPASPTTGLQTMQTVSDAMSFGAAAGFRALTITSAITWTGNVNATPHLVFNWNTATTYDNGGTATNVSSKAATIYRDTASYAVTGAGAGTLKTLTHHTVHSARTYSTTLSGSTVTRDAGIFYQPTFNSANWAITDAFAAVALVPGGSGGTVTRWGGLYVDDPAGITPTLTTALSVYSKGASVQLQHAGPGVFGAAAAATNASVGLEVQSTTQALLLPRMTTTQANAMTKVAGMMVYDTTLGKSVTWDGAAWQAHW